LKKKLGDGKRPVVLVEVPSTTSDTSRLIRRRDRISLFCTETGFKLIDAKEAAKGRRHPDSGRGIQRIRRARRQPYLCQSPRRGQAVDQATGKIVAIDRQPRLR